MSAGAELIWDGVGRRCIHHTLSDQSFHSTLFLVLSHPYITTSIVSSKMSHCSYLNQLTLVSNCLLNSWHSWGELPKYQALGIWAQTFKLRDLPLSLLKVRRLRHIIPVLFFKKKVGRSEPRHSHNISQCGTCWECMASLSHMQNIISKWDWQDLDPDRCIIQKQVQQNKPPCPTSQEWPSAHLCGFFLAPPLEPFHIVDLVHLDLKGLLQRSRHRRQVHPLTCRTRLLPQGGGVWQGCWDQTSSLEAYKAREVPVTVMAYNSSICSTLWVNMYESHSEM